ncbi:hypothetical protein [Endozoicomonas sp.]|uniref:hypothetical protein n=1 Tax=Endozoicomonas sp. TaxID=1892382 RepID=UPI00383B14AC
MKTPETRHYPTSCLSAYCGQIDCRGCRLQSQLDKFKTWKEETNAVKADPIWNPSLYIATSR